MNRSTGGIFSWSLICSLSTFVLCLIPFIRNSQIGSYVKFGPMGFMFLHFFKLSNQTERSPCKSINNLNNDLIMLTRLYAAFADLILHGEQKSELQIFIAVFLFSLGWISFFFIILNSNYRYGLIQYKWYMLTVLGKALFVILLIFGFFVEFFIVYHEESTLKFIYGPYILCQIITFVICVFFLANELDTKTILFIFGILFFAISDLIVLAEMKFHVTLYLISWPLYYVGQFLISMLLWNLHVDLHQSQ